MRLDSIAMAKIKYLEAEYGQLSNVPETHPYISKLLKYGKNAPLPKLDTAVSFHLTKEELSKVNKLTKKSNKMRTTLIREWIVEYINNPIKLNLDLPIKKDERLSLNIYLDDFKKINKLADSNKLINNQLVSIIVKSKINELS